MFEPDLLNWYDFAGGAMPDPSVLSKVRNPELVAERQAHLIQVATELMTRQGFHKTTVRQIAQAAGWTMPTLYMYIRSKEDVLYLCARSIQEKVAIGIENLHETGSVVDDLVRAAWIYFKAIDQRASQMALMYREIYSLPYKYRVELIRLESSVRELFADIIRRGVDAGEFQRGNVDVIAYDFVMLAHMWALKQWAFDEQSELRMPSTVRFSEYADVQIQLLLGHLGVGASDVDRALEAAVSCL